MAAFEPWLLAGGDDRLYPRLCGTWVLQPDPDNYLVAEYQSVCRAMAQWGDGEEVRRWFFSRYDALAVPDPLAIDTEVRGEGYPGFWRTVAVPGFLVPLVKKCPEDAILAAAEPFRPRLALDLGCGQGGMIQRMAQICTAVFGLEHQFYLACLANRQLPAAEIAVSWHDPRAGWRHAALVKEPVRHARVICGDVYHLPFPERRFDWVHCGHLLDLVDDPLAVMGQVARVLKPGGLLSLCTPWDFPRAGHFDNLLAWLADGFEEIIHLDGLPWLRYQHKRRHILHEDFVWMGKARGG